MKEVRSLEWVWSPWEVSRVGVVPQVSRVGVKEVRSLRK